VLSPVYVNYDQVRNPLKTSPAELIQAAAEFQKNMDNRGTVLISSRRLGPPWFSACVCAGCCQIAGRAR